MTDERELHGEEAPRESSGEYLLRVLKPAGAVFVLALMVLFFVICFTHQNDPVRDYTPLHTREYYAAAPAALEAEIRDNLLAYLPPCTLRAGEGGVEVTAAPAALENLRASLGAVFGEELFLFTETAS